MDTKQIAYTRLLEVMQQRSDLQAEQKFAADMAMALHRAGIVADNIEGMDVDENNIVGAWLKRGDYAGKLRRKALGIAGRKDTAMYATIGPVYIPATLRK